MILIALSWLQSLCCASLHCNTSVSCLSKGQMPFSHVFTLHLMSDHTAKINKEWVLFCWTILEGNTLVSESVYHHINNLFFYKGEELVQGEFSLKICLFPYILPNTISRTLRSDYWQDAIPEWAHHFSSSVFKQLWKITGSKESPRKVQMVFG